jgi:hypothetical protein
MVGDNGLVNKQKKAKWWKCAINDSLHHNKMWN